MEKYNNIHTVFTSNDEIKVYVILHAMKILIFKISLVYY